MHILSPLPLIIAFSSAIICCTPAATAQRVCGTIYMTNGTTLPDNDSTLLAIPKGNKDVQPYEHAYTKKEKKAEPVRCTDIDSVSVWMRTAPNRRHTLIYEAPYGWCWLLDRVGGIRVYAYCKDGYTALGNGGMAPRKKYKLIVKKGDAFVEFKDTHKMADAKFRRRVADLVADDPSLSARILGSRQRRDRTVRMLADYSSPK